MRIEILETRNRTHIKPKLNYVISLINNMVMYLKDSPLEVKFKLIGLMFPQKLEFDGKQYRTNSINRLLDMSGLNISDLTSDKKEIGNPESESSQFCTRSRSRTGTSFTSLVFETNASTDSAIRASIQEQR